MAGNLGLGLGPSHEERGADVVEVRIAFQKAPGPLRLSGKPAEIDDGAGVREGLRADRRGIGRCAAGRWRLDRRPFVVRLGDLFFPDTRGLVAPHGRAGGLVGIGAVAVVVVTVVVVTVVGSSRDRFCQRRRRVAEARHRSAQRSAHPSRMQHMEGRRAHPPHRSICA